LPEEGTEGVKVNAPIAVLLEEGESANDIGSTGAAGRLPPKPRPPPRRLRAAADPAPAAASAPSDGARVFASPLARRIAKDKGLDLAGIKGSGPHGRIVKADVEGAHRPPPAAAAPAAAGRRRRRAPRRPQPRCPPPQAAQVLKMYGRAYRGGHARRHARPSPPA
jgi:pyruvate dehydrogenase E2 component (dihydrolipoamide acetyltransferase)